MWICSTCRKIEQAWDAQDNQFEEVDKNDLIARVYKNGASKRDSRLRNKAKKKAKEAEEISRERFMDEDDESEDDLDMFNKTNAWAVAFKPYDVTVKAVNTDAENKINAFGNLIKNAFSSIAKRN